MKGVVAFFVILVTSLITPSYAANTTMITIGSGSTTGVYYPVAVGIAKMINHAGIGVRANARSTGGSVYNALALERDNLQLAIMQSDIAYYASKGIIVKAFKGNPVTKLRGIATLYPEIVQITARKKSGITSISDLRGHRVYTGDVGSGVEQNAKQILQAYGLTLDDIKPVRGSASLGTQLLQDGRIDAMFYTAGIDSAAIQQLTETTPVQFLSIDKAHANDLQKKYPFYSQETIPAKTYKGQEAAVPTIAVKALLVTTSDLDPKTVQLIVEKVLFNHLNAFKALHYNLKKDFTLNKATHHMPIPMDQGAIAAYKALGIPLSNA